MSVKKSREDVSVQVQSGPSFKKKSICLYASVSTVYIYISKAKMEEILETFPDIAQEG